MGRAPVKSLVMRTSLSRELRASAKHINTVASSKSRFAFNYFPERDRRRMSQQKAYAPFLGALWYYARSAGRSP